MAAKRKRKRNGGGRKKHKRVHARKRTKNPRRTHHRAAKRHVRRHKRRNPRRFHHASAPRKRHKRRNPRRAHHRRARRRNPGIPAWLHALLGAGVGAGVYALVTDGSFAATQRLDPSMATLGRNRAALGGVATLAGLYLATKEKTRIYGVAIAAAGFVGTGVGTWLTNMLGDLLDQKATTTSTTAPKTLGAVYGQSMQAVYGQSMRGMGRIGAYQQMGAVYGQSMRGMGNIGAYQAMGAYRSMQYPMMGMGRMGEFSPAPPWSSPSPF